MTSPSEEKWQQGAEFARLKAEWAARERKLATEPAAAVGIDSEAAPASARPIVPAGLCYSMLLAAVLKSALQDESLKPHARLDLLEMLNSLTGNGMSTDMLMAIEPMCKVAVQMLDTAESLDKHAKPPRHASFNMWYVTTCSTTSSSSTPVCARRSRCRPPHAHLSGPHRRPVAP
jgi:hypothetical protein